MELKKFWVRNFKSLKDVTIELPTKLTVVIGPSGSGKTALVEAFEILSNQLRQATVGVEIQHNGCNITYELSGGKKTLMSSCSSDKAEQAVQKFLNGIVVIKDIDWKAIRRLRSISKEEKLLPDASNFLPFLYSLTGGEIPESFIAALKYVFPQVSDLKFVAEGNTLVLQLITEDGVKLTQATMPSGVLKTLILKAVLETNPALLVIDEFENSLDPEAQQFLIDELRSNDVYALLITHSEVVVDYVKTPKEVVMLRFINGETKAWRFGSEVEEALKRSKLTLSELIGSGLLPEPPVFS
jgi:predicted ATPase